MNKELPTFAVENLLSRCKGHAKSIGNALYGDRSFKTTHLEDLIGTQDFSDSAFLDSIPSIIVLGSKEQMIYPNTTSVITTMENEKVFGHRAMYRNPRKSVSGNGLTVNSESAISRLCFRGRPEPTAVIGFDNFTPESFHKN